MYAVYARSDRDVWIGGSVQNGPKQSAAIVEHWNGTTWVRTSPAHHLDVGGRRGEGAQPLHRLHRCPRRTTTLSKAGPPNTKTAIWIIKM